MKITQGGKNNFAPYSTTHVRVPVPIKHQIESQIAEFKRRVSNGELVLNGTDIYIQTSIGQWEDSNKALGLLEEFMKDHSAIGKDSPRNKNLMNFKKWLERKKIGE